MEAKNKTTETNGSVEAFLDVNLPVLEELVRESVKRQKDA